MKCHHPERSSDSQVGHLVALAGNKATESTLHIDISTGDPSTEGRSLGPQMLLRVLIVFERFFLVWPRKQYFTSALRMVCCTCKRNPAGFLKYARDSSYFTPPEVLGGKIHH